MALQIALVLCLVSGEVHPKVVADRIEAATTARDFMLEYEGTFSFPGEQLGGEAGFGEGGLAEKYVGLMRRSWERPTGPTSSTLP